MKKLLNKKGFTLMEMLIVIAIIVILVAISIPAFSGSLEKANKATDAANLRSAKAAYVVQDTIGDGFDTTTNTYYYDLIDGEFKVVSGTVDAAHLGSCTHHTSAYITVNAAGDVYWSNDVDCEHNDTGFVTNP